MPSTAQNINFGVLHTGEGAAWFDSLEVEFDVSVSMEEAIWIWTLKD